MINDILRKTYMQTSLERQYSRTRTRELILQDIMSSPKGVYIKYEEAVVKVKEFYNTRFWDTKAVKVHKVKQELPAGMAVLEVLIACLPYHKEFTMIQNIATQVAPCIPLSDIFDRIEIASELITCVAEADLIDIEKVVGSQTSTPTLHIISRLTPDFDTQFQLQILQYPLPMLSLPKSIKNNYTSGYLTWDDHIILGNKANKHNKSLNLNVINTLQNVPLSIDLDALNLNDKLRHKGIDMTKPPSVRKAIAASFTQFDAETDKVISILLEEGNTFYLTANYDKRGRLYCKGYHVSYQGVVYQRSLINFTQTHIIEDLQCTL